jgi:hypothetical protein
LDCANIFIRGGNCDSRFVIGKGSFKAGFRGFGSDGADEAVDLESFTIFWVENTSGNCGP